MRKLTKTHLDAVKALIKAYRLLESTEGDDKNGWLFKNTISLNFKLIKMYGRQKYRS